MKKADCIVKLSKDHEVILSGVTPIEALILVAEHHKNVGGNPVEVVKGTEGETGTAVPTEVDEEVDGIVVKDGKKIVETTKRKVTKLVVKPDNRTNDQELDRLRGKYSSKKIQSILTEVRDLPTTFELAIERGIRLKLPTGALVSTKL